MEHVNSLLDLVTGTVTEIAQSDVVVGEPIEMGDVTIVPLSRVSLGFGAGGGQGEAMGSPRRHKGRKSKNGGPKVEAELDEGKGMGGGAGGGGKVRPVGVIIFGPDGVTIEPIPDKMNVFDKVFDKIPEVIDMINDLRSK